MKLPFSPSKTWWTIVALLIVVGVFLYGLSQGMLWPLMYASTILVGILLFIAVSLDHSWGALAVVLFNVLGTLLVLGVIGAVLFPNLLGIVIALIGFRTQGPCRARTSLRARSCRRSAGAARRSSR